MNTILRSAVAAAALALSAQAAAEVVFYESERFEGTSFTATQEVRNLERAGMNDRASSVVVVGERWEVCEDRRFRGRCMVLRPGRYPSLSAMGLNDRVSSVRMVSANARIDESRYAPMPQPVYDNRRRRNERMYQANVTSVRAIAGTPEQRCWMEKEAVQGSNVSVPGAVVGAVLGGILGHQIGSGSGNTIATVGGAVAGGAAGSQVGRLGIGGQQAQSRDVQRCENVSNQTRPDHWDVTYDFRGQEHRVQMTTQPGSTIRVNERGEPRA
jgi:uncharacterized protein YcfJ